MLTRDLAIATYDRNRVLPDRLTRGAHGHYVPLAERMLQVYRTFDGPASVLRETRRYGVAMAKFLPALLACRGWRAHAVIQTPRAGWHVALDLSPADGLHTHLPAPEEFDSDVESEFARKWGSEPRDGWTLSRESDILHLGQKVFLPDFTFQHECRTAFANFG